MDTPAAPTTSFELYGVSKAEWRLLPAQTRAFAIVGCYMGYFAMLESFLDEGLIKLAKMDELAGTVIMRNMQFSDKIYCLRVFVNLYIHAAAEREHFNKLAKKCIELSKVRNVVAHNAFGPSATTDGVRFLVTKASNKLEFPPYDWSVDAAFHHISEVEDARLALLSIPVQRTISSVADALMSGAPPRKDAGAPSGFGSLFGIGADILGKR